MRIVSTVTLALLLASIALCACPGWAAPAASVKPDVPASAAAPSDREEQGPGFAAGFLRGLWSPVMAFLSLFSRKYQLVHLGGGGVIYNVGFLLGVAADVIALRRLIIWRINARRRRRGLAPSEQPRRRGRSELIRWVDEDGMPVTRTFEGLSDELSARVREALEEEILLRKLDDETAEALLKASHRALREGLAKSVEPDKE